MNRGFMSSSPFGTTARSAQRIPLADVPPADLGAHVEACPLARRGGTRHPGSCRPLASRPRAAWRAFQQMVAPSWVIPRQATWNSVTRAPVPLVGRRLLADDARHPAKISSWTGRSRAHRPP